MMVVRGRFFSVDPLTAKYPWYTPYQFSGNKVLQYVELEGLEEYETNDGTKLGKIGNDQSTRVLTNIASGSKEAKNIEAAIKLVNQLDNKINEDTKNMPKTEMASYLNYQENVYVQGDNEIRSHLVNSSIEKHSVKWALWKVGQLEIGTSSYWSDEASNFTAKDLGDGKVAFYLPDTDLFILASGSRSGPKGAPFFLHDNSKVKTFTQFLDRANKMLKGTKIGMEAYQTKQQKVNLEFYPFHNENITGAQIRPGINPSNVDSILYHPATNNNLWMLYVHKKDGARLRDSLDRLGLLVNFPSKK